MSGSTIVGSDKSSKHLLVTRKLHTQIWGSQQPRPSHGRVPLHSNAKTCSFIQSPAQTLTRKILFHRSAEHMSFASIEWTRTSKPMTTKLWSIMSTLFTDLRRELSS